MKKFLSVLLVLSIVLSGGFFCDSVKASIIPITLQAEVPEEFGAIDPHLLKIRHLEALQTFTDLQYGTPFSYGTTPLITSADDPPFDFGSNIYNGFKFSLLAKERSEELNTYKKYSPDDIAVINDRILEVQAKINSANLRIADLRKVLRSATTHRPLLEPISGLNCDTTNPDTIDINIVKQELNRVFKYKESLYGANSFWQRILKVATAVTTVAGFSVSSARVGETVSIIGENLKAGIYLVSYQDINGQTVYKTQGIGATQIISPTEATILINRNSPSGTIYVFDVNGNMLNTNPLYFTVNP